MRSLFRVLVQSKQPEVMQKKERKRWIMLHADVARWAAHSPKCCSFAPMSPSLLEVVGTERSAE